MGFSKQEYWSGVPLPSLGDLPDLGIEPASLSLAGDSSPLSHQGSQCFFIQKQISEINSCIKDEIFSYVFLPLCLFLWVVLIFIFGYVRQLAESQFPKQELNLGPQQWKLRIPATGPPRNFQYFLFDQKIKWAEKKIGPVLSETCLNFRSMYIRIKEYKFINKEYLILFGKN